MKRHPRNAQFMLFAFALCGSVLFNACSPKNTAKGEQRTIRADIDKDIPLAEGIRRANEQFPDAQPLTEDEVVAAVRAIKLQHPDIKEQIYEIYQRVAKERVLPKDMYFSHISAWETEHGHFEVDWKDLTLRLIPTGADGEKMGFNYRIRARFVSSRPLTQPNASSQVAEP